MILANIINPVATNKSEQKSSVENVVNEETQSLENGFMAILDGELNQQEESVENKSEEQSKKATAKALDILTPMVVNVEGETNKTPEGVPADGSKNSSLTSKEAPSNELLKGLLAKNMAGDPTVKGEGAEKINMTAQKVSSSNSENKIAQALGGSVESEENQKLISSDEFLTHRSLFKNANKKTEGGKPVLTLNAEAVISESVDTDASPVARGKLAMNEYKGQGELLQKSLLKPQAEALKIVQGQQLQVNPLITSDKSLQGVDKLMPEVLAGPDQGLNLNPQNTQGVATNFGAESAQKVVSFSSLDQTSTHKLINQISEYIDRAKFENTKTVDMVVRHEQLGEISIQAQKAKAGSDLIEMKIQTSTPEGMRFFQSNEVDLLKSLSQNGVRLSDFKLSMTTETHSSSSGFDKDSSQSNNGQSKFGDSAGAKDQQGKDSDRRRQLWNEFQERASA